MFRELKRVSALLVSAAALISASTAAADEPNLGAYLKARYAASAGDYIQASQYFEEAIETDPNNVALLSAAHQVFVLSGEFDQAVSAARSLKENGTTGPFLWLSLIFDEVRSGNFESALELHDAAMFSNPFLGDLLRGWLHVGAGDKDAALELFGKEVEQQFLTYVMNFHRGLTQFAFGDLEAAAEIFAGLEMDQAAFLEFLDEYYIQYAKISVLQGDLEAAERLLSRGKNEATALEQEIISAHLDELEATGSFARDLEFTAEDGIAEAISLFAWLLASDEEVAYTRPAFVMRFAEMVDLEDSTVKFRIAEFLEAAESYALAARVYESIGKDGPLRLSAGIERVEAMYRAGDIEETFTVLDVLSSEFPDSERVPVALGNIYRYESRFEEAVEAYDDALAKSPDRTVDNVYTFYFRGISLERAGRWEEAKADLNLARELSEGLAAHPYILNYLGYSMLMEEDDIAEAEAMIRIAVEAEPENGAFVDSLGWALYLLGRYDEALVELEKALKLEPTEPEIIEHLGDVYWQVCRRRDAEFQWRRALSFDPDDEYKERIGRKLEIGLDAEHAEPDDSSCEAAAN